MPFQYGAPLHIDDFTGGMTDNFVGGAINAGQLVDNVLITKNKKLHTRPGSDYLYDTAPAAAGHVLQLWNFKADTALLVFGPTYIQFLEGDASGGFGSVTTLGATAFTSCFLNMVGTYTNAGANTFISCANWGGHVLVTNGYDKPLKIYHNSVVNAYRATYAGLPKMLAPDNFVSATELTNAIALATNLISKMGTHFTTNPTYHKVSDTVANGLLPANPTNLATLLTATHSLQLAYNAHYKDSALSFAVYHQADTTNGTGRKGSIVYPNPPQLPTLETPTTLIEAAARLNELRKAFELHSGDVDTHGGAQGAHVPTVAALSTLTQGPYPTVSYQDLYDLANSLKDGINAHIGSYTNYQIIGTATLGSATITAISAVDVAKITVGDVIAIPLNAGGLRYFPKYATVLSKVVAGAASTATLSLPALQTVTATFYMMNPALKKAHGYVTVYNNSSTLDTMASELVTAAAATSLSTLRTLLFDLRRKYTNHVNNQYNVNPHFQENPFVSVLLDDQFLAYPSTLSTDPYLKYDAYGGFNTDQLEGMLAALLELQAAYNTHDANGTLHYGDTAITGEQTVNRQYNVSTVNVPSLANYNYAFVYSYQYDCDGTTFLDLSTPLYKAFTGVRPIENGSLFIDTIPSLQNAATLWDIDAIRVRVYRTTNNGSTYYYVGDAANGIGTYQNYTDAVSDVELQTRATLYTTDGVPGNDAPPKCKVVHVLGGKAYYGNITENSTGNVMPYRMLQSVPDDIDSVPETFSKDFTDTLVSITSFRERIIVLCASSIHRAAGQFNADGSGEITSESISASVGCIAPGSVVQTEQGVFFLGKDGVHWTDGYTTQKMSYHLNTTYLTWINSVEKKAAIRVTYDTTNKRVIWSVAPDATAFLTNHVSCDTLLVLDLEWGLKPTACFTTWGGNAIFNATAVCFYNGAVVRACSDDTIQVHRSTLSTDLVSIKDGSYNYVNRVTTPVIHDFKSVAYDFSYAGRKWVSRIAFKCLNEGNLSLQLQGINDIGKSTLSLKPYLYRGSPLGLLDEWRHFPKTGFRCDYKQVRFTNAVAVVTNSDTLGLASSNGTANTVTLAAGSWPTNAHGYAIAFEGDAYVAEWVVTQVAAGVLTVADAGNTLPTASGKKWVLRGYPKGEFFHLQDFDIHWAPLSMRKSTFDAGEDGSNA